MEEIHPEKKGSRRRRNIPILPSVIWSASREQFAVSHVQLTLLMRQSFPSAISHNSRAVGRRTKRAQSINNWARHKFTSTINAACCFLRTKPGGRCLDPDLIIKERSHLSPWYEEECVLANASASSLWRLFRVALVALLEA